MSSSIKTQKALEWSDVLLNQLSLKMACPKTITEKNISVVIPCLNAEACLKATLKSLKTPGNVGVIKEIIVVDGGSQDNTMAIAEAAGARVIKTRPSRGLQLASGARIANGPWLLFLHSDTELTPGWWLDADFMTLKAECAGYFTFQLNARGIRPWLLAMGVKLRNIFFALPYGDQGLVIHKTCYDRLGGHPSWPLMEDVAIARQLGRQRLKRLKPKAITSAERYRDGYIKRIARNLVCLSLYMFGTQPEKILTLYERRKKDT